MIYSYMLMTWPLFNPIVAHAYEAPAVATDSPKPPLIHVRLINAGSCMSWLYPPIVLYSSQSKNLPSVQPRWLWWWGAFFVDDIHKLDGYNVVLGGDNSDSHEEGRKAVTAEALKYPAWCDARCRFHQLWAGEVWSHGQPDRGSGMISWGWDSIQR